MVDEDLCVLEVRGDLECSLPWRRKTREKFGQIFNFFTDSRLMTFWAQNACHIASWRAYIKTLNVFSAWTKSTSALSSGNDSYSIIIPRSPLLNASSQANEVHQYIPDMIGCLFQNRVRMHAWTLGPNYESLSGKTRELKGSPPQNLTSHCQHFIPTFHHKEFTSFEWDKNRGDYYQLTDTITILLANILDEQKVKQRQTKGQMNLRKETLLLPQVVKRGGKIATCTGWGCGFLSDLPPVEGFHISSPHGRLIMS